VKIHKRSRTVDRDASRLDGSLAGPAGGLIASVPAAARAVAPNMDRREQRGSGP